MADSDSDDLDSSSSFFSNLHVTSIVLPILVLLCLFIMGAVVVRRKRLVRRGLALNQQGRHALARDVLEDGHGGTDALQQQQQQSSYMHSRHRPHTVNRWAWTNTANLATVAGGGGGGGAGVRRREDGFNELGEAPPPYELATLPPKAAEDHVAPASSPLLTVPAPTQAREDGGINSAGTGYLNDYPDAAAPASLPPSPAVLSPPVPASLPPSYSPSATAPGAGLAAGDR